MRPLTFVLSSLVCFLLAWVAPDLVSAKDQDASGSVIRPAPTPITSTQTAKAEFERLLKLALTLEKIPIDKQDAEPHRSFLIANDNDIVYSEPAGRWYVRSERFWDLSEKFRAQPIAEDIAWSAARNPVPGECEGYINCHLYVIKTTYGRYLSVYPNGKHSTDALMRIKDRLSPIVADLPAKSVFKASEDNSDRAELKKLLEDLKDVLSKSVAAERSQPLSQLERMINAYK